MPWAVNTPDGQVRLTDLPFEVLDKIETETGLKWTEVIIAPASSAKCALAVYAAACERTGSEPAELTPGMLVNDNILERVEDDLPEVYADGIPKAQDETPTSGSSGAPKSTGGRRKSSAAKQSET